MQYVYYIASIASTEENTGLLGALGIDWKMLVLQSIAFLVLVWLLGKFVYPHLIKAIDTRQEAIEASARAAQEAQAAAEKAEEATEAQLTKAKKEAADIIATAQKEATSMIADAEDRATKKADHLIEQAEARLAIDISEAKNELRKELVGLVAQATEVIIGEKLDAKKDAALIERAIKVAKK